MAERSPHPKELQSEGPGLLASFWMNAQPITVLSQPAAHTLPEMKAGLLYRALSDLSATSLPACLLNTFEFPALCTRQICRKIKEEP